jgi:site-specific DNA recombinase
VVVYKVDRLTRSLADFAKLVELFDQYGVSFVSIAITADTAAQMEEEGEGAAEQHDAAQSL